MIAELIIKPKFNYQTLSRITFACTDPHSNEKKKVKLCTTFPKENKKTPVEKQIHENWKLITNCFEKMQMIVFVCQCTIFFPEFSKTS